MKHSLDDRFTLSSDNINWILIEKQKSKKVRKHYFSDVKQLSNFIEELNHRDCLASSEIELSPIQESA